MKKNNIFIIEDSTSISILLHEALKHDYDVSLFTTAEAATDELKRKRPDIIITDIMLPGMSGLEFCSLLKASEEFQSVPVIALSAKVGSQNRTLGYNLGIINYLEKPFEISELKTILKAISKNLNKATPLEISVEDVSVNLGRRLLKIKDSSEVALTPIEFTALTYLLRNHSLVVKKETIQSELNSTEDEQNRSVRLENTIHSLRKKLTPSKLEIKTHYSAGYELRRKVS